MMRARSRAARRLVLGLNVILWAVVVGAGGWLALAVIRDREQTARTTARFDPPVLAGQNVIGGCSGGFYARADRTVVLLISAHCSEPGATLRDGSGRPLGVIGPRAQFDDCPQLRFCAPSDFMTLALAPDRIPWGHLNFVDMGAGGYRTMASGTQPLACDEMAVGQQAEVDGRERYRAGPILAILPYQHEDDTMFPCMIVVDVQVGVGDSGGAVLVDGLPAGIISRTIGGRVGFTPLAEGLENLGLTLCTTPDCDLTPADAVQPGV